MSELALVLAIIIAATTHLYFLRLRSRQDRLRDEMEAGWTNPRPTCQLLEPTPPPFTREAFLAATAMSRPRQKIQRDPLLRVSVGLGARRAKAKARTGGPVADGAPP